MIVEKFCDNQFVGQVTNGISFSSSDTNIVRIEANEILPVEDGAATIRAKVGGQTVAACVIVEGMKKPFDWKVMGCTPGISSTFGRVAELMPVSWISPLPSASR